MHIGQERSSEGKATGLLLAHNAADLKISRQIDSSNSFPWLWPSKENCHRQWTQLVMNHSKGPGRNLLSKNEASRVEDEGKLGPNWEGPYRVTEAFENGSYKLQTMR
ncbi:hypothetical protein Tco_0477515 [Tanacetum coccineum]